MASNHTNDLNLLGLEIRRPVVDLCLRRKASSGLRNVHFLSVNANVDLTEILSSLQKLSIPIDTVTIQFPDPHFKSKHKKRRVVNAGLVSCIAKFTSQIGSRVFLQSDIEELQCDMVDHFEKSGYFDLVEGYDSAKLGENVNPFEEKTEREIATYAKGLPVFRMLYRRNTQPFDT